ncbi:kelch-like protein 35 [Ranitomeya imitator]|uniref:kelch-like protein 35 n=1 Tax=Ranitomeya imitator TaxID=111125 RepID=UPI0037E89881
MPGTEPPQDAPRRVQKIMDEELDYSCCLKKYTQEPRTRKARTRSCSGACHAKEILQNLNIYRQSGIFTDVVLLIEDQTFPCHRGVLSANSSYFRAMFGGKLKESNLSVVKIEKISARIMNVLLDFMYGGNPNIEEDNVEDILQASDLLHICSLRDECVKFLDSQLDPSNCLGIMKFADMLSIISLSEKSKKLMLECFEEVSCHEEFLELTKEELTEYLSSDNLVVSKEETVYEAVMRWVKENKSRGREALKDLLEHVRLPLMDPAYFLEKVEMDKTIQECPECFPLLHEARRYLILGNPLNSLRVRPRRFMNLSEAIVIIGGCDKKGILKLPYTECYHPKSGQWTTLPSIPGYTKSEFAATTLKNNIYVSGGHINISDVWMFSTQLNSWLKVASLNKGRWRHKMAVLKGEIYSVGGFDGLKRLSSVERYNAFKNSWSSMTPMLEAVTSAAVVSCMNKLYVIGGAVEDCGNTDKVQCYDPETDTWTYKTSAPFSQRCINGVELDGLIYVVGGLLSKIFSYNPKTDAWNEVASLPGALESCGVTVCGGKMYILGGRDENGEGTENAFVFDPRTGQVDAAPPLQRGTSYHGCVTILHRGAG